MNDIMTAKVIYFMEETKKFSCRCIMQDSIIIPKRPDIMYLVILPSDFNINNSIF